MVITRLVKEANEFVGRISGKDEVDQRFKYIQ